MYAIGSFFLHAKYQIKTPTTIKHPAEIPIIIPILLSDGASVVVLVGASVVVGAGVGSCVVVGAGVGACVVVGASVGACVGASVTTATVYPSL